MADGYDGKLLVEELKRYLAPGSSVLELGMGPGKDLILLAEDYRATGSDNSSLFIERFISSHPDADVIALDAVSLDTERTFDCIYSNKVLHHLSHKDIESSFRRQGELLDPKGLVIHSFWYGTEIENYEDLMFYQVTEDILGPMLEESFEVIKMQRYTELEENDSLLVILRLR